MKTPKVGDLLYSAYAWHDVMDEYAKKASTDIDTWVIRTIRRPPQVYETTFERRAFCVEKNKFTWVSYGRHQPKTWSNTIPEYWERSFAITDPKQAGLHTTKLGALRAALAMNKRLLRLDKKDLKEKRTTLPEIEIGWAQRDIIVYTRLVAAVERRLTREKNKTKTKKKGKTQ